MTGLSSVDVRSIGAGGGSLAWVDPGGLLRVGPQSAGADPGPACYGRGGEQPTVTDAALVLGYLDPEFFLGGRMALDEAAARRAIGALAERFEQSHEDIAVAILTIAGEAMVQAIQELTINEGIDPRESLLVAGGGAAGLNDHPHSPRTGLPGGTDTAGRRGPSARVALTFPMSSPSSAPAGWPIRTRSRTAMWTSQLGACARRLTSSPGACGIGASARFETRYFVEARYPSQVVGARDAPGRGRTAPARRTWPRSWRTSTRRTSASSASTNPAPRSSA